MTDRVRAAGERVVEAVRELDAALVEAGTLTEREPGDMLTDCLVVGAWRRLGSDAATDAEQVQVYAVPPMTDRTVLGTLRAATVDAEERYRTGGE